MKKWILYAIVSTMSLQLQAQSLERYETFEEFEAHLVKDTDKAYVVNFWATWCAPCVEELPYFEELHQAVGDDVEVVLVSLDFKRMVEKTLVPFLDKNKISSRVIFLADGRTSRWIDKVSTKWSGALPATIFIKGDQRVFKEKTYHSAAELQADVKSIFKI